MLPLLLSSPLTRKIVGSRLMMRMIDNQWCFVPLFLQDVHAPRRHEFSPLVSEFQRCLAIGTCLVCWYTDPFCIVAGSVSMAFCTPSSTVTLPNLFLCQQCGCLFLFSVCSHQGCFLLRKREWDLGPGRSNVKIQQAGEDKYWRFWCQLGWQGPVLLVVVVFVNW